MDAYLVEIESPEENTWIYQHVKSIPGKIFMETKIALHICIYLYIYFFLNSRFDFSWILQKKNSYCNQNEVKSDTSLLFNYMH